MSHRSFAKLRANKNKPLASFYRCPICGRALSMTFDSDSIVEAKKIEMAEIEKHQLTHDIQKVEGGGPKDRVQ